MKKILYIIGALIVIGAAVAYYVYNKPHQNIAKAEPDITIGAVELYNAFEENEESANERFLDKIVLVEGEVLSSDTDDDGNTSVTLKSNGMFGVICRMDNLLNHKRTEFEPGETVKMKGLCTGMLMDVILVRCVEVE